MLGSIEIFFRCHKTAKSGMVVVGTGGFDGSVVQDMVQELVSVKVVVAVLATLLAPVIGDLFLVAVVVDLVGQVVLSMLDMVMVTATREYEMKKASEEMAKYTSDQEEKTEG